MLTLKLFVVMFTLNVHVGAGGQRRRRRRRDGREPGHRGGVDRPSEHEGCPGAVSGDGGASLADARAGILALIAECACLVCVGLCWCVGLVWFGLVWLGAVYFLFILAWPGLSCRDWPLSCLVLLVLLRFDKRLTVLNNSFHRRFSFFYDRCSRKTES